MIQETEDGFGDLVSSMFVDQTLINTPIPMVTSTVDKKSRSPDTDPNRIHRLNYVRRRSSWLSNVGTPKPAIKRSPISDSMSNVHSYLRKDTGSSSGQVTEKKSAESFKSILNLQTMEDLSGSLIDAHIVSCIPNSMTNTSNECVNQNVSRHYNNKNDGDKENENVIMPVVGTSPRSTGHKRKKKVTYQDSSDSSFPEDITLNWDEITRPPSPPVNDDYRKEKDTYFVEKDRSVTIDVNFPSRKFDCDENGIPSRFLGRTNVVDNVYGSENNRSIDKRLESILASDTSDLSSNTPKLQGSVSNWIQNLPSGSLSASNKSSFNFTFNDMKRDFEVDAITEHENIDIGSGFNSTGQMMNHLEAEENEANSTILSAEQEIRENMVTPSSSWCHNGNSIITNETKPVRLSDYIRNKCDSKASISGIGLSAFDSTPTHQSGVTTHSRLDFMPSIEEEEDALEVTLTDKNTSEHFNDLTLSAEKSKPLSVSLLRLDTPTVVGERRGEKCHPLASSTAASLTADSTSSEESSSLVNLSDIRNVLENDMWESHGQSGVASFVQSQLKTKKANRNREVNANRKTERLTENSIETASSRTVERRSASYDPDSPQKWVSLQESFKIPPTPLEIEAAECDKYIDLKTSKNQNQNLANPLISSLVSSQATTVVPLKNDFDKSLIYDTNNSNSDRVEEDGDGIVYLEEKRNESERHERRSKPKGQLFGRQSHEKLNLKTDVDQILFPFDVSFEDSYVGSQIEQSFNVTNRSRKVVTCSIDVVYCSCNHESLSNEETLKTFLVRPSVVIGPNTSRTITMSFKPIRVGNYVGEMLIKCNSYNLGTPMLVNLRAIVEEPRLKVILSENGRFSDQTITSQCGDKLLNGNETIDFGSISWNSNHARQLMLVNEGNCDLPLSVSLSTSSILSQRSFSMKIGDNNSNSLNYYELNLCKHGGRAILDIVCNPSKEIVNSDGEETSAPLHSTCNISMMGASADKLMRPLLLSYDIIAQVGSIRLVIPMPYSTVRLNGKENRCHIPIKNIGSIPASVRVVLDCPVTEDWLMLQLLSDRKMIIAPGSKSSINLSYNVRRNAIPTGVVTATLFVIGDPKGPVYEIPVICEPSNACSLENEAISPSSNRTRPSKAKPPVIASKSVILWSGVNVGNGEKQRVVLKNTTKKMFSVNLYVENLPQQNAENESNFCGSDVFLLLDPMSGSRCKEMRLDLQPNRDTTISILFRPQLPRYFRSRLLIRALVHKTAFVIGLRGYGGHGDLICANSESPLSGDGTDRCVKLLPSKSSQLGLVLYNRGDRTVWANTKATGGSVEPSAFLVRPSSAKTLTFKLDKNHNTKFDLESKVEFIYGDEILRQSFKLNMDDCFSIHSDTANIDSEEQLPSEDFDLDWRSVYGDLRTLNLQIIATAATHNSKDKENSDGTVEGPTTSQNSSSSSPLRETMMRVGDCSTPEISDVRKGHRLSSSPEEKVQNDPLPSKSSTYRSKPHVEEWLRHQQELSASSPATSFTRVTQLLKVLTPMDIEFHCLDGYQERTVEWMNVSGEPLHWSITCIGPPQCNSNSCAVSDDPYSERFLPWSPFFFAPSSSQRLDSSSVERVRVRCSLRQDGALPSLFLRRHAGCNSGFVQHWTLTATSSGFERSCRKWNFPKCSEGDQDYKLDCHKFHESHNFVVRVKQLTVVNKQSVVSTASKTRIGNLPMSSSSTSSSVPPKSRLLIKQREVRFPLIHVHGQQLERLKVTNRSGKPLAVLFRALPEPFRLGPRAPSQLILKAAHCVMLPLVFRPAEPGRFQALLIVECPEETDEPAQRILLTGEAAL